MQSWWSLYLLAVFMLGLDSKLAGQAFQPEFVEPITNLTVAIGRNATFRCLVQNLGGYRVGWVKADTKAIQAIHVHVITNNHRVGVSHNGQTVWNLHIRNVQEEDRGQYMCQINTDPMQSQMGYLDVVIPPDFIPEETSSDVMVPEGGTVRVSCRARGIPAPVVVWRREDGADIVLRDQFGGKNKVNMYKEEVLTLSKVSRSDMGAYLCIASNGVPPTVSKRILIKVHFHPVIQVPNQLVGAPLGTDVTLECYVESSPKSINYWVRDSKIPGPTARNTSPATSKEEYKYSTPIEGPDDQGSADRSDDDEDKEPYYATERANNIRPVLENTTKNRSFVFTPSVKQKLSNKVSKILNQLEIEDSDFELNSSSNLNQIISVTCTFIAVAISLLLVHG
ncbi:lachesin-like isoform X2 [Leguminivora glycinivorella]|uniref:lachesin-like isoform X2 n=1 Tax=Leguminivora glycinivorella TaxID=1035111 RepID=UPI00200FAD4F|nr:lachesin-like isoform X2 [Leguminivora glycinivorella]